MNKLSVSIIIPAYNEADQIVGCLQAIANQTVAPQEVIVIDNNSVDDTVCLAKNFPFVTVIQESQQGIVHARNAGFDYASGDILARIDADTNPSPNWVETIKELASTAPTIDAFTGPCQFRDTIAPGGLFVLHRVVYFWSSRLLLGHTTLFGSNMFLHRQTWLNLRHTTCLQTDVHEDMDLATHLVADGGTVHFSKKLNSTISNRRWKKSWNYPRMWLKAKTVHWPSWQTDSY